MRKSGKLVPKIFLSEWDRLVYTVYNNAQMTAESLRILDRKNRNTRIAGFIFGIVTSAKISNQEEEIATLKKDLEEVKNSLARMGWRAKQQEE